MKIRECCWNIYLYQETTIWMTMSMFLWAAMMFKAFFLQWLWLKAEKAQRWSSFCCSLRLISIIQLIRIALLFAVGENFIYMAAFNGVLLELHRGLPDFRVGPPPWSLVSRPKEMRICSVYALKLRVPFYFISVSKPLNAHIYNFRFLLCLVYVKRI